MIASRFTTLHSAMGSQNQSTIVLRCLSSIASPNGVGNTSTKVSERAIIDRIAAPGTGKNRKVPKVSIDYLEGVQGRSFFSVASPNGVGNTSTKVGERAIIDRIAAPGTGKNRKVPKVSIDYLEGAGVHQGTSRMAT
jgi:hypothetical protein